MNQPNTMNDDFCLIAPTKVFALSVATCGLYLVYWYEMQYAKSKKLTRSVFMDFLKSYFFVFFSFKLSEKIHALLGKELHRSKISHRHFFIAKFLVIVALESIFYYFYSIHVFLLSLLIIEAAYAAMLQGVINEQIPSTGQPQYPWQLVQTFHIAVLVGGLALILFFQFSENPLAYFKK